MTDTNDREPLDEFGQKEHERSDIPDGAFIYRTNGKTFVGYLESFSVDGTKFRPKFTGQFAMDRNENYLYEFRDALPEENL